MNRYKLSAYSAAAAAMVAAPSIADAQMVHVNIDPDIEYSNEFNYHIDLNDDDIIELNFRGYHYSTGESWGSYWDGYESQWVYLEPVAGIVMTDGVPKKFAIGESVSDAWGFNSTSVLFFQAYQELGTVMGWPDVNTGASWVNNPGYIGLRFSIDGATHYGWIRLVMHQVLPEYMPNLVVTEFAYNATPDQPAPITQYYASKAHALKLSDVGETNTPDDLQLTFQKAPDESSVTAYRIYIFPYTLPKSLSELTALPADRYLEVYPTGEDHTINFDITTLDINGNELAADIYYRAYVISVADGVNAIENDISLVSNYCQFDLEAAPSASSVALNCNFIDDDITGFLPSFDMSSDQVSSSRLYITTTITPIETLLNLDEAFYMEVDPVIGSNSVFFTADKLIYNAGDPVLYGQYNLQVISMPDSITNSLPSSSDNSGTFFYAEYHVKPEITFIDNTGTSADLLLNFPLFPNETNLDQYRIYISKAGTAVTPEMVADLPPTRYRFRAPAGTGLDMDLAELKLDIDGDSIRKDQLYKVYVGLKHKWSDYISLSEPSEIFKLGESVDTSGAIVDGGEIMILDDEILVVSHRTNGLLSIVDVSGRLVFQKPLYGIEQSIPLPELSPGVYIAYLENVPEAHPVKFIVQ